MTWTLVNEDEVIHVRAIINVKTEQDDIHDLITALGKRLLEEKQHDRTPVADV